MKIDYCEKEIATCITHYIPTLPKNATSIVRKKKDVNVLYFIAFFYSDLV